TRKRPKGQLNSDLGQSRLTVLGSLLGIKIPLNRNFLRNYVLVLGARKTLIEELEKWKFQVEDRGVIASGLKDEVPFGKVLESGALSFLDGYVPEGEPLVAVASRVEDLAAHCANTEPFSKAVLLRGHIKSGQRWSHQNRPTEEAWDKIVLLRRLLRRQVCFRAPTSWTAFENMAVMEEAIEHGGNGGAVAEQFAPVIHRSIRSKQSAGALIATHYDF